MRFVYLTSTAPRHTAFLQALVDQYPPALIVREPKRPSPPPATAAEQSRAAAMAQSEHAFFGTVTAQYPAIITAPGDINNAEQVALIRAAQPDVLLVFGTSLLRPAMLALPKAFALNIHTGITQLFRGVDSAFWAIHDGQPEGIGATVHYIDQSIDAGQVVAQARPSLTPQDNLPALFHKSVKVGCETLRWALGDLLAGRLQPRPLSRRGRLYQMADMNSAAQARAEGQREACLTAYLAQKAARDAGVPLVGMTDR
jgi:methionyl-tRNA formyltransferase